MLLAHDVEQHAFEHFLVLGVGGHLGNLGEVLFSVLPKGQPKQDQAGIGETG